MKIAVIGGGISGISAAKVALRFGHEVVIIEKEESLGGLMAKIANCRVGFKTFFDEIKDEPNLKVMTKKVVSGLEKKNGRFFLTLNGYETIEADRIIIAVGLSVYEPEFRKKRVLSSFDFDSIIDQRNETLPEDFRRIAFVLCAGSRRKEYPLCSAVCCSYTLRQIKWTFMRSMPEITVFYNDLRFFGQEYFLERLFREANVRFLRTNTQNIEETEDFVRLRYYLNGKVVNEDFNYVVLTSSLRPNSELIRLAEIFGFSLNQYGFVSEPSPLRTDAENIFACGGCLEPMNIKDSIITGYAAGYLASGGKERERERKKIFRLDDPRPDHFSDGGSRFVLYLGASDPYTAMFYEFFSHRFLELAYRLKEEGKEIYVLTRNVVAPSYGELLYQETRKKGVIFIHLEESDEVVFEGNTVHIKGQRSIKIEADRLILMEDLVKDLKDCEILGFTRSEPQLRWSPTKWANDRYHVGLARYPREKRWEMREYYAALAEMFLEPEKKQVAKVQEERCSGCASCEKSCLSGAIEILRRETKVTLFGPYLKFSKPVAHVSEDLCVGCGSCVATCPSHAIEL